MPDRRDELAASLRAVRERLVRVCLDAGRDVDDVTVIAVTKTWPASDVALLAGLGVRDVGENRHQEGLAKRAELGDTPGLRWHHIGVLQGNKARAVTAWADVLHGVDRAPLLERIPSGTPVLLQVSLDGDPARGGCAVTEVPALGRSARSHGLDLRGVMAVAPRAGDPAAAFALLARTSAALREEVPDAMWISAGMSGDWEAAVTHGATHVRLGSVLLGGRSSPAV